jgi:hypothetical protein
MIALSAVEVELDGNKGAAMQVPPREWSSAGRARNSSSGRAEQSSK